MKKIFITLTLLLLAVVLGACGKKDADGNFDVPDGTYFAAQEGVSNGYRYYVTVEVEDKKITDVEWNGYDTNGGEAKCAGDDKWTCSDLGVYGMNGDMGTWAEQADATEKWIVDNQQIVTPFTASGGADAITTASIHTREAFDLVYDALAAGPVASGDYEDGYYYIETEKGEKTTTFAKTLEGDDTVEFDTVTETYDTYTFGTFVIVNGTIVIADFNATQNVYEYLVDETGSFVKFVDDKGTADTEDDASYNTILMIPKTERDGTVVAGEYVPKNSYVTKDAAGDWYGMSQIGKVEWADQVRAAEDKLLADQSLTFGEEGIDDLASVSIHVTDLNYILTELDSQAK